MRESYYGTIYEDLKKKKKERIKSKKNKITLSQVKASTTQILKCKGQWVPYIPTIHNRTFSSFKDLKKKIMIIKIKVVWLRALFAKSKAKPVYQKGFLMILIIHKKDGVVSAK